MEAYRIGDTHSKTYDTIEPYLVNDFSSKGGGSAYGGKWKPSSDKDNRLSGTPGEIKTTYNKNGEKTETLIGKDGKATKEVHYSTHSTPNIHTNPHGHEITYDEMTGYPSWSDANGIGSDYLKPYTGGKSMSAIIYDTSTPEENRFKTISDFKWSMKHGAEVLFKWNGVKYGAFGKIRRGNSNNLQILICQVGSAEVNRRTEQYYYTPDEALEYMVGTDRLRDVITQVTVLERTI